MTEMCLYEIAAAVINAVVSGASIEFGGVAKAVEVDHFTPMEPKWASEVAHGVIGMTRSQGNEIVKNYWQNMKMIFQMRQKAKPMNSVGI